MDRYNRAVSVPSSLRRVYRDPGKPQQRAACGDRNAATHFDVSASLLTAKFWLTFASILLPKKTCVEAGRSAGLRYP
jgi:hypothetical protein